MALLGVVKSIWTGEKKDPNCLRFIFVIFTLG